MPTAELQEQKYWTLEAIRERRRSQIMAAIYSAFGDESSDDKRERVFAVAGIFGRQDEWDAFSKAWFKRTDGRDFRASDCESNHGDFSQTSPEENRRLYRDLTKMLCGSTFIGFGIAISLEAHQKHFPGNLFNSPYLLCFAHVVMECAHLGQDSIPPDKVKFTFHTSLDYEGTAGFMYQCFPEIKWARSHEYLEGEVGFGSHKGYAPIQASDLLARETMKRLYREIMGITQTRLSMEALVNAKRFIFTYLRDAEFAALGRQADELSKDLKGANRKDYEQWRLKQGCQDTEIERMRYMMGLHKSRPTPRSSE